jgi:predicted metal-dependent hydrolase
MMLDYDIVRTDRKTIGITVERDRKVVVRAPRQASDEAVTAAVNSKRLWIWQKVRDPHKYPEPQPHKEYVSGETFLYLGEQYSLQLSPRATGEVRLSGSQFHLARQDRKQGDSMFRTWYLQQARQQLSPRIAALAHEMGLRYTRIWVRDLKYRWGSCSPGGTLSFNWRIIQAPTVVIDYLIVHELAHVLEPNHSEDFWNIVAVHVPGWKKARGWLKEHGSKLEW